MYLCASEQVDNLVSGHMGSDGSTAVLGMGEGGVDLRGDSVILHSVTGELGGVLKVLSSGRSSDALDSSLARAASDKYLDFFCVS